MPKWQAHMTVAAKGKKRNLNRNVETLREEYGYVGKFVKFNGICIIAAYVIAAAIQAGLKVLMAITRYTFLMSKILTWKLKHED